MWDLFFRTILVKRYVTECRSNDHYLVAIQRQIVLQVTHYKLQSTTLRNQALAEHHSSESIPLNGIHSRWPPKVKDVLVVKTMWKGEDVVCLAAFGMLSSYKSKSYWVALQTASSQFALSLLFSLHSIHIRIHLPLPYAIKRPDHLPADKAFW